MLKKTRDILLRADSIKLAEHYYKQYVENLDEPWEDNSVMANKDTAIPVLTNTIREFKQEIEKLSDKSNNEYILTAFEEYDWTYDESMQIIETTHRDILCFKRAEIQNIPRFLAKTPIANSIEELTAWQGKRTLAEDEQFEMYSLTFEDTAAILSYDMFIPDNTTIPEYYDIVTALLYELTFFGWETKEADKEKERLINEIENSIKEYSSDNPEHKTYSFDDLRAKWNLPPKSEEQKKYERDIINQIMVKRYNQMRIDYQLVYNALKR